jgi:hypothetical protein
VAWRLLASDLHSVIQARSQCVTHVFCGYTYFHRTKLTLTYGHSAQDREKTDMKSRMESKMVRNVRERATKENKEE